MTAQDKSGITKALADLGDRTLAGGPGDGTLILQAALKHPVKLQGAITVNDPETVTQASAAGAGAKIKMHLVGKVTSLYLPFQRCRSIGRTAFNCGVQSSRESDRGTTTITVCAAGHVRAGAWRAVRRCFGALPLLSAPPDK
ncbi:MlrC C-terminal domain-containing protein [Mesorhizobium japonicum]|uniref:Mll6059 protein n=1 Tax=Mesorhizobium japonicum (strain LMG 29417 / CECT 9101 / MAFF 303099) TaxID=266835 RepID=Q98AC9_RHILO|nr:MlrC C-terminal domain-containing protein [Mesorhizobium japonicum]BAB52406.1 mll6059 [Mesorhizobium japonicum MAFF 303099]